MKQFFLVLFQNSVLEHNCKRNFVSCRGIKLKLYAKLEFLTQVRNQTEISYIDDEFSDSERDGIMSIIKSDYHLSDEDAKELMAAADEERKGKVDLWHFTTLINKNYSAEEKKRCVEMLWRVVYADNISTNTKIT